MGDLKPEFRVPSRRTIGRRVDALCGIVKEEMARTIQSVPFLALTADGWTSKATESYVTVTGHWLTENFESGRCVLALRPLEESHNIGNLREAVVLFVCLFVWLLQLCFAYLFVFVFRFRLRKLWKTWVSRGQLPQRRTTMRRTLWVR